MTPGPSDSLLHLNRWADRRRIAGSDDKVTARISFRTGDHIAQWADRIDDGAAGRVGHELGKRLDRAAAVGAV